MKKWLGMMMLVMMMVEVRGVEVLRVGHFPNITHVQALVARQLGRQGNGWYEKRLGVEIQWMEFNAGPSAMESIFAKSLDLTYVGPGPALNAYQKAMGSEIRVVSGAVVGGAGLVVRGSIAKPEDFRGKRLATPQLGNTQDVAARVWLKKHGYRITQLGGDVNIVPTANPDQLALFQLGQIDAAWTVEPWVSRLELEGKGKLLLEEKEAITTVLAASVNMVNKRSDLLKKFVAAHVELTKWIEEHPAEAKELVRAELKELTKREFPVELTERAWARLRVSSEISRESLESLLKESQSVGFLKGYSDLSQLVQVPK